MLLVSERYEVHVVQQAEVLIRVWADWPAVVLCAGARLLQIEVRLAVLVPGLLNTDKPDTSFMRCMHLFVAEPSRERPFIISIPIRRSAGLLPAAEEDDQAF